MERRQIIAVGIGTTCVIIGAFGQNYFAHLAGELASRNGALPIWSVPTQSLAFVFHSLLPGFVAGWISQKHGILVGFIAGIIGATTYHLGMHIIEEYPISVRTVFWILLINPGISHSLSNAAAGGAAQLLRSNKSLQPTAKSAVG